MQYVTLESQNIGFHINAEGSKELKQFLKAKDTFSKYLISI